MEEYRKIRISTNGGFCGEDCKVVWAVVNGIVPWCGIYGDALKKNTTSLFERCFACIRGDENER